MVSSQKIYQAYISTSQISTDTRQDVKDTIFFALSGDRFNGNLFAAKALEKGARYAVVDDPQVVDGEQYLLVKDVLVSLQELAKLHRSRNLIPLLAITGSNGKTTTKNLISAVLSTSRQILSTAGNYNNHIGVPITLLGITRDTEYAVVEMGANHIGEIGQLCQLALPNVGIITNIGKAHLEGFGSYEGVIRAKSELYNFLRDTQGTVIVNADDPLLMELSEGINRFTYGRENADVKARITRYNPYLSIHWEYQGNGYELDTFLYGKYNFSNILAAISSGLYFGIPADRINQAIGQFKPDDSRSQVMRTNTNQIILDAYNANPVSMSEAILSFKEYRKENQWLILGDMFELGEAAVEEHRAIVDLLVQNRFQNVLFAGEIFHSLEMPEGFLSFPNTDELDKHLLENPLRNAHILIKGSRGMRLEKVLNLL